MVALLASLATCAVIVWTVRRLWPERTAFALVGVRREPGRRVPLGRERAQRPAGRAHDRRGVRAASSRTGRCRRSRCSRSAPSIKATAGLPLIAAARVVHRAAPARAALARRRSRTWASPSRSRSPFSLPFFQLQDPTLGMLDVGGTLRMARRRPRSARTPGRHPHLPHARLGRAPRGRDRAAARGSGGCPVAVWRRTTGTDVARRAGDEPARTGRDVGMGADAADAARAGADALVRDVGAAAGVGAPEGGTHGRSSP